MNITQERHGQTVNTNSVKPFLQYFSGQESNLNGISCLILHSSMWPHQEKLSPLPLHIKLTSSVLFPWFRRHPTAILLPLPLLRSHSNSFLEESSEGPAASPSQILSPPPSYPPGYFSLPNSYTRASEQTSASAFNVNPLWSLDFRPGFPVFPSGHPCFIPTLAAHHHLAGSHGPMLNGHC